MKNFYAFLSAFLFLTNSLQAQSTVYDTVSTSPAYAKQVWYNVSGSTSASRKAGEAVTNNWDIAFEVRDQRSTAIHVNHVNGVVLYRSNKAVGAWSTSAPLDTAGFSRSVAQYDTDTLWQYGAFNITSTDKQVTDVGWGNYNVVSHSVIGDSIYILKLSDGTLRQFMVESLSNGSYYFKYAKIDGTDQRNIELKESDYPNRNNAYYSLLNNVAINREPANTNWDLVFHKYFSKIPDPANPGSLVNYPVTGILQNYDVLVAKVTNRPSANNDTNRLPFNKYINTIGYDWKSFNGATYDIRDSLAYFVKLKNGYIYKLVFTGFGGGSNGNFYLGKTALVTSVSEVKAGTASIAVYPNPTADGDIHVVYDFNNAGADINLQVFDLSGRTLYTELLQHRIGLNDYILPALGLKTGMYLVRMESQGQAMTQKIMVK
jgi:hypothetical protein